MSSTANPYTHAQADFYANAARYADPGRRADEHADGYPCRNRYARANQHPRGATYRGSDQHA